MADHVYDIGMQAASDHSIWNRAEETGAVIITKDEDFTQIGRGASGPQVVWLRLGNVSALDILETLGSHRNAVAVFSASADEALLVVPCT